MIKLRILNNFFILFVINIYWQMVNGNLMSEENTERKVNKKNKNGSSIRTKVKKQKKIESNTLESKEKPKIKDTKDDSVRGIGVVGIIIGLFVSFYIYSVIARVSAIAYFLLTAFMLIVYIVYTENHSLLHNFTDGFLMGFLGILIALFTRWVLFRFRPAHRKLYASLITIPTIFILIIIFDLLIYGNTLFTLNTPETIYPSHYLYNSFNLTGGGVFDCTFNSTSPVYAYILTGYQFGRFKVGLNITPYYSLDDVSHANISESLEPGHWYIVIVNPSSYNDTNVTFSTCPYP